MTLPYTGASFFLALSAFISAAFTKTAVQVKVFPSESSPVPFHSDPLLIPLKRVAEAGSAVISRHHGVVECWGCDPRSVLWFGDNGRGGEKAGSQLDRNRT